MLVAGGGKPSARQHRGLFPYGWSIPFLASIVMVAAGLYVRLKIEETPVFRAAVAHDDVRAGLHQYDLPHQLRHQPHRRCGEPHTDAVPRHRGRRSDGAGRSRVGDLLGLVRSALPATATPAPVRATTWPASLVA
ncbi:MAG: hypothetical protein DLM61_10310 [Pseudonocardiales bacterium]|nr:MAG: hypothetical protein DLM61_10310 [Pseudonocardiales bacterium]